MRRLDDLLAPTDVLLISDEVYEHMVFDGQQHQSAARFPGLAARAFIVSSFGKTYHVTGWKVGTVVAPAPLTAEFRKVHQFNVFTVNTPMQHALAAYMADPAPYLQLSDFYQRKRDLFRDGLAQTRFRLLPGQGTYFQCVGIETSRCPNATCPRASSASGSRARSAWRPFRCRRSTATASTRKCALLLRQEGRDPEGQRWSGWPGCDTAPGQPITVTGPHVFDAEGPASSASFCVVQWSGHGNCRGPPADTAALPPHALAGADVPSRQLPPYLSTPRRRWLGWSLTTLALAGAARCRCCSPGWPRAPHTQAPSPRSRWKRCNCPPGWNATASAARPKPG